VIRRELDLVKEVLANLDSKHKELLETVARQGDELAETRRLNSELGGRAQQLEEENRLLRESIEGLKDQLTRVEAKQEGCNADLRKAITDLQQKLSELTAEISGLNAKANEVPGIKEAIAKQAEELAANGRRTSELVGRIEQLEEGSRPKRELAQVEAGQQSGVAPVPEAVSVGGSTMTEDPPSVQGEKELTMVKEEIKRLQMTEKQFPPLIKKGGGRTVLRGLEIDMPDGIIAHLTRECGGNVHDCRVVNVTAGSFEKRTIGLDPRSGEFKDLHWNAPKYSTALENDRWYRSAFRNKKADIPHTRNNWLCYDFKEKRIVPTHYAIRAHDDGRGDEHMKSWLVETSLDGENWREVDHQEDNDQLNGSHRIGTFAVAGGEECRFIRLVQIGRNHFGDDRLCTSGWEIFGSLFE
jgi:hypothetical protein